MCGLAVKENGCEKENSTSELGTLCLSESRALLRTMILSVFGFIFLFPHVLSLWGCETLFLDVMSSWSIQTQWYNGGDLLF